MHAMTHKPMYSYVPYYVHTYIHACRQAGMHACTHTYKCINIHQYIYICIYICRVTRQTGTEGHYTCIYIYMCIYMYMYDHRQLHMFVCMLFVYRHQCRCKDMQMYMCTYAYNMGPPRLPPPPPPAHLALSHLCVGLSVCLPACCLAGYLLAVCLSVFLSVCLSACLPVCVRSMSWINLAQLVVRSDSACDSRGQLSVLSCCQGNERTGEI